MKTFAKVLGGIVAAVAVGVGIKTLISKKNGYLDEVETNNKIPIDNDEDIDIEI